MRSFSGPVKRTLEDPEDTAAAVQPSLPPLPRGFRRRAVLPAQEPSVFRIAALVSSQRRGRIMESGRDYVKSAATQSCRPELPLAGLSGA